MADRRDHLPLAAAALLVVPYLTVSLPFRWALMVQAGVILSITAGAAVPALFALARSRGRGLSRGERPLWIGGILWTAAALVGLASALASGNDGMRVAGQLLALLLLPLGLVAGLGTPSAPETAARTRWRKISRALVLTALAACLLHFAVWLAAALRGLPPQRLYLENSVSVAGALPLVLVLLLALRPMPRWRGLALAAFILYLAGSGSRGAWLAAGLGAALLLFWTGRRTDRGPGLRWRWAAVALVLVAVVTGLGLWLDRPRDNELASAWPADFLEPSGAGLDLAATAGGGVAWNDDLRQRILVHRFPVRPKTTYRLRGWFRGGDRGRAYAALRWVAEDGEILNRLSVDGRPSEVAERADSIAPSPPETVAAIVYIGCREGSAGDWELERLEVHRLGPGAAAPALRQLSYLLRRMASLLDWSAAEAPLESDALDSQGGGPRTLQGDVLPARSPEDLESIEFRLAESVELWQRFRDAPLARKLWGHGLGATFRVAGRELNYVHNLYAYLLFKLGLVGGLLLLAGVAVWVLSLLRWRRRQPGELACAALAAVWAAYLAWGLVSPEILDFRLAPLFGILLGSLPAAATPPQEAAGRVL